MAINEYGESLDRNGYARSLFNTEDGVCFICDTFGKTERHEIYGAALRDKSKALGLWIPLCPRHHRTGKDSVHQNEQTANHIKSMAQHKAMAAYGWDMDEWMRRFYKNYLEDET